LYKDPSQQQPSKPGAAQGQASSSPGASQEQPSSSQEQPRRSLEAAKQQNPETRNRGTPSFYILYKDPSQQQPSKPGAAKQQARSSPGASPEAAKQQNPCTKCRS